MYAPFDPQDDLAQGDIVDNVVLTYLSDIAKPSLYDANGDEVNIDLSQPLDPQQEVFDALIDGIGTGHQVSRSHRFSVVRRSAPTLHLRRTHLSP